MFVYTTNDLIAQFKDIQLSRIAGGTDEEGEAVRKMLHHRLHFIYGNHPQVLIEEQLLDMMQLPIAVLRNVSGALRLEHPFWPIVIPHLQVVEAAHDLLLFR